MKQVLLKDVCEFLDSKRVPITANKRKPGPYPYYGANGQQDSIDSYIFDEPLVLLAEDGGHFGSKTKPIAYKVTGKCWVNNHAHVLRPKSNIDVDYLHRALSFYDVTKYINGTTRKKMTKGNAENIVIPLPSLPEQKRIAAQLAQADRLRQLRRNASQLGESYLQSAFLAMFGDPVKNPKGWELKRLKNLCVKITDGTHDTPQRTEAGVPFITSKNIHPYEIDLSVLEYVSEETHQEIIKRCNPEIGDIIYTNIGANLGTAAMNKLPFSFSLKNVALLQPNHDVLSPFYLEALLNNEHFKENLIFLSSAGGAQKFITLNILRTISIPYPPLSEQERFAQIVARYEKLRAQMHESTRQAEMLFQGLLHESFGQN